jgi:hypothetical protein
MTFGYDSDLRDKRTVMTLQNWAETLLYSLNEVRTSEKATQSLDGNPLTSKFLTAFESGESASVTVCVSLLGRTSCTKGKL